MEDFQLRIDEPTLPCLLYCSDISSISMWQLNNMLFLSFGLQRRRKAQKNELFQASATQIVDRCRLIVALSIAFTDNKKNTEYHQPYPLSISPSQTHLHTCSTLSRIQTCISFAFRHAWGNRGKCMLLNTSAAEHTHKTTSGSNVPLYWSHLYGRQGCQLLAQFSRQGGNDSDDSQNVTPGMTKSLSSPRNSWVRAIETPQN